MNEGEIDWLASPAGQATIEALRGVDPLRARARFPDLSADQVAAALTQARHKPAGFPLRLVTADGIQQATPLAVAKRRATRLAQTDAAVVDATVAPFALTPSQRAASPYPRHVTPPSDQTTEAEPLACTPGTESETCAPVARLACAAMVRRWDSSMEGHRSSFHTPGAGRARAEKLRGPREGNA